MPFPSFDSRMYHQSRAEIIDLWATPISKNTLATTFPLILEGKYHPSVTSKPMVPCQMCMFNVIYMEYRMTRIEKKNLDQN